MTRPTASEKRENFFRLHETGCFLIPNPWDAGSARMLEHLGFPAIATTSTGYAWSTGRPDYQVTLGDALDHLKTLCAAVDIPVNADFEWGFARSESELQENVGKAIRTGVAALSVEDRDASAPAELSPVEKAASLIGAARKAIDATGERVMLVGRTEELLIRPDGIKAALDRLRAYRDAGADCLYAPGVTNPQDIEAMVRVAEGRPVNVLALSPDLSMADYAQLGVRRVSIGGAFALVAWAAAFEAAKKLKDNDLSGLSRAMPGATLNAMFAPR
jgi:2-methylisocitrate lyase-like PEP mutase family enzyme